MDIADIEKVELEIGPVASTAGSTIREPKIGVEGKFSIWFLAALALREDVNESKFTDEMVNDPDLVNLHHKVSTKLDPVIGFGARVAVTMKNGTVYSSSLAKPKGDPDNPLTQDELEKKFAQATESFLKPASADILMNKIRELDSVANIGDIIGLTKPAK